MTGSRWTMTLGLIAAGVGVAAMLGAAAGGRGKPTAIAVVDVQKVMIGVEEQKHLQAELQTMLDRAKEEEQKSVKKLQDLAEDLKILAPGSPAFNTKREEFQTLQIEVETRRKVNEMRLRAEQAILFEGLYRKIVDTAGRAAQENGFDMVLVKEADLNLRQANPEQLAAAIMSRKVLWAAAEQDLTEQVLQKMNNEYKNRPPTTQPK